MQAYFSRLTIMKMTKETNGQMDERARKIGLVSIAGVVVCMCQPLPRFWVIVYVCKLLGFSSILSVYSCILIHVSTFSEVALWLLNHCMAFRTLTGEVFTQAKAKRSSDAPLQWFMLYMLAAIPFIFDFNVEAHQFFS